MTEPTTNDIVGPDIPPAMIPFTDEQLRAIWARIQLIDQHFERCCAFQRDGCHYGDESDELYGRLHMAGVEQWKTPFDNDEFEAWMASRGKS